MEAVVGTSEEGKMESMLDNPAETEQDDHYILTKCSLRRIRPSTKT